MTFRHGWLHAVIDQPGTSVGPAGRFWERALGWPLGPGWPDHPELRSFVPPGADPSLHLQHIDGPTRVHLDVEVEDLAAGRAHWLAAGAEVVSDAADAEWWVLRSPGGLLFCLVPGRPHRPQHPVEWPAGHRTRLVQACIDLPPELVDTEVAFWRAGLDEWRWEESVGPEFLGRLHGPEGTPVRLLFQRLDDPTTPTVQAHLDLGSDDLRREADRHRAIGATELWARDGFIALRDPTGMVYCVTANDPGTGPATPPAQPAQS